MKPDGNAQDLETLLERPLPARSLIASLLLRTQPPRMRGARLVQWCGLFGVADGTARVALSRMVERGELRAHDGIYELAGRVQRRRGAQDWSLEPELQPWRGDWRIAVVAPGPREAPERSALREAMRRLRYAPLREGMWTRPDNLPRVSAPAESWSVVEGQCSFWSGRPHGDAAELAEALFDSVGWSQRAAMLTRRLSHVSRALERSDDGSLADAFVTGAAALAHVRSDALLPPELAADSSSGDALRDAYGAYERAFSESLRTWFRTR